MENDKVINYKFRGDYWERKKNGDWDLASDIFN